MKYFVLLIFLFSCLNAGFTLRKIVSPRSVSLGSSIKGNIGLNEIVNENTAGIAFSKSYTGEAYYTNIAKDGASLYGASIVDSRTSKAAGAFNYSRVDSGEIIYDVFYLALAEKYFKRTSLFLGGSYVKIKSEEGKSNFYDLDTGFLTVLSKSFAYGMTMKSLLNNNNEIAPRELAFGVQLNWRWFFPAFSVTKMLEDGLTNSDKLKYSAGVEVVTIDNVFVRSGYNRDEKSNLSNYALGLAWKAPRISFDYAFERGIEKSEDYQHLFSSRIYF